MPPISADPVEFAVADTVELFEMKMTGRTPSALLLDFDGVVVDSVEIKLHAFQDCYPQATAEQRAVIAAYQHAHGGVSRREKFRYFERAVFGRAVGETNIETLSARYRDIVADQVLVCPMIPGALEFLELAAASVPLHLVSGTPDDELKSIVSRRGLDRFFGKVIGAPTQKVDAFRSLCLEMKLPASEIVAVGDSLTEFAAAEALGMGFVGITAPGTTAHFPKRVPVLPDMRGLADLLAIGPVRMGDA